MFKVFAVLYIAYLGGCCGLDLPNILKMSETFGKLLINNYDGNFFLITPIGPLTNLC